MSKCVSPLYLLGHKLLIQIEMSFAKREVRPPRLNALLLCVFLGS